MSAWISPSEQYLCPLTVSLVLRSRRKTPCEHNPLRAQLRENPAKWEILRSHRWPKPNATSQNVPQFVGCKWYGLCTQMDNGSESKY